MEPGTWSYYIMYDFVYIINMLLSITVKCYAIRFLHNVIVNGRWPKAKYWLH